MSPFYLSLCVAAFLAGMPLGYAIGSLKNRPARVAILPGLMLVPALGLVVWMFHLVNDDIDPIFWAGAALVAFVVPLLFWCIAAGCGYYLGSKHRLDRQAERGGMID